MPENVRAKNLSSVHTLNPDQTSLFSNLLLIIDKNKSHKTIQIFNYLCECSNLFLISIQFDHFEKEISYLMCKNNFVCKSCMLFW